ncbi:HupE/UreJ family protein [Actinoplanes sp. CA-142083]|uniref:HupE/UreJ family protein n=1 Tax=Actinoplanes sp. CA-142083 TaxID=3239903 RepID=UPI003D936342
MIFAHGVDATGQESLLAFVELGLTHMLTGWDHLLFIAGVVLLAWHPRRAAGLLSLFALGHSTTLITATLAGWRLDAGLVDIVIADSVAFVGVAGLLGRPARFRWFGAAVLAFGLVHGLGLATRFQALPIPAGGSIPRLLAFNVGVELGQVLALYLLYVLGELAVRASSWPRAERAIFAGLTAVGLATGIGLALP